MMNIILLVKRLFSFNNIIFIYNGDIITAPKNNLKDKDFFAPTDPSRYTFLGAIRHNVDLLIEILYLSILCTNFASYSKFSNFFDLIY